MSPTRARRLTRRTFAAGLVAVLIFAGAGVLEGLYQSGFGEDVWGARFENIDVGVGDTVDVDGANATVVSYESAYRFSDWSGERQANGIFLIVTLRGEFPNPGRNDIAEVAVDYAGVATEPIGGMAPGAEPGFGATGAVVFDLEPARLAGARVTIAQKEVTFRYRTRAVVDLGIDEARAAELRAVPQDKVVTLPRETDEVLR